MKHWNMRIGIVLVGLMGIMPSVAAADEALYQPGWVIESADYTGEVKDQIARFEIRYTIRLVQDGWAEIPLNVQGATVTSIDLKNKTGEAHIAPRGNSYVLMASKKGGYQVIDRFIPRLRRHLCNHASGKGAVASEVVGNISLGDQ